MDNPQYYQPLSHALHPPLVSAGHSSQQQYSPYGSHAQSSTANGATHREEEEEEEEDDEEVVEEELDHNDNDPQPQTTTHTVPQPPAPAQTAPTGSAAATATPTTSAHQDQSQAAADDDSAKRKPGRPRGSRNRKPRAAPATSTKAPANSQHPGFYQYPPAPAGGIPQNQQFFEFQWRALNLCSEFYNAAEELVKAASPMVIAQCYQMGPAAKIDPLAMIAEAKRVCDNLLANPSQLLGNPPPLVYGMHAYGQMPPQPTAAAPTSAVGAPNSNPMITNASSFVMSLGTGMPPPSHAAQSYYPAPMYTTAAGGYPRAPYYSYPPQPASYYPPPAQPAAAAPTQSSPPPSVSTGTISTFNAATGSAAPGGQQGTWSEEETERLRNLAERSRETGGPQNKGEAEWEWVVTQWGNSRTRHQILLKAVSMGLKVSTTRGTKRRRETDASGTDSAEPSAAPPQPTPTNTTTTTPTQSQPAPQTQTSPVPNNATTTTTPSATTVNASPALPPQRPPSSSAPTTIAPARTTTITSSPATTNMPWPMPTVAANTPSPVLSNTQVERNSYYRPRPTQAPSYGTAPAAQTTSPYGAVNSNTASSRPPSSHGNVAATHQYMYRPNGTSAPGRRDG